MTPACVAFDMVETTFSLEKLRPLLVDAGLAPHDLELWFAEMLRDAFALDTIGQFVGFPDLARSSLGARGLSDECINRVIDGFATLDVHADAGPAFRHLRDRGVEMIALTNGSEHVTRTILARNGLIEHVARIISIAEIGHWKPAAQVYRYAADAIGQTPDSMALIAAHPWDCAGAKNAGYTTGFIDRTGAGWPNVIPAPDHRGRTLSELVRLIAP